MVRTRLGHLPGLSCRTWVTPIAVLVLGAQAPIPGRSAAGQDVDVAEVHRLSIAPQPFPLVESWLAVNPKDPDNLLASAMSVSAEGAVIYASWDGGATWSGVKEPDGAEFPGGDPTLTFDAGGVAYFSTITPLRVWRSMDGGRTWTDPPWTGVGRSYDREWLAAGPATAGHGPSAVYGAVRRAPGPDEGNRPVIATVVSGDGGATFTERAIVLDSGYVNAVMGLAVRRDGTVLLPVLVNYGRVPGDREIYRGRRLVVASHDGARSWSEPHAVAENIQLGNSLGEQAMRGLGIGYLAVDESGGPFDGTLYMAWGSIVDDRNQILFSHSADEGVTWSQPMRVNDGGIRSDHSVSTVAVNDDGVVAVTWNDRRDDPSDRCFRPYVAISRDGGRTFGPNRAISERPTCPAGGRWLNGGDTNGLVALPDGGFRVTWTAGTGRDLSIWTAVLRVRTR